MQLLSPNHDNNDIMVCQKIFFSAIVWQTVLEIIECTVTTNHVKYFYFSIPCFLQHEVLPAFGWHKD